MTELAGRLTERVRFERRGAVRGAGGEPGVDWERFVDCQALVEPEGSGRSGLSGDGWQPGRRWRVTLRSGPALTLGMRMLWRGLVLRVAGIELDPGAADRLTLWVEDPGL